VRGDGPDHRGVSARAGHALLIECATGRTRHIPFRGRLLLVDTGVRHELAAGALNERQAECAVALQTLASVEPGLEWLAAWPSERLGELRRLLGEPLRSRALHVVTETDVRAAAALLAQDGSAPSAGARCVMNRVALYACSA
jgi:galactokinase